MALNQHGMSYAEWMNRSEIRAARKRDARRMDRIARADAAGRPSCVNCGGTDPRKPIQSCGAHYVPKEQR